MAGPAAASAKSPRRKILILGGGFGGIKVALSLIEQSNLDITLLSDHENFRYYPTLYHTATGGSRSASSIPLKEIFADKKVRLIFDSGKTLDRQKKRIRGSSGKTYPYDVLIVAMGVVTNFFGIQGLEKYAYGIKTNDEADRLRKHLHQQLVEDKKPDLNYVIIGGGPTGVELAGALGAYIRHIMKRHGLKDSRLHVDLVEAAPRLMPRMPRDYSKAVQRRLHRLGVKLYLNQAVQAETADALMVNGRPIASHTVVWTAGVTNHPFLKANEFKLTDHGKAAVDQYLQAEPSIYVIGDNADTPFSGMAQTALHDGQFVAANLKRQVAGRQPRAYKPKRPVYVTPVGKRWAAVLWNKVHIYGRFGSFLRSAADFAGYHDYEPWWPASKHWLARDDMQDDCPTCKA